MAKEKVTPEPDNATVATVLERVVETLADISSEARAGKQVPLHLHNAITPWAPEGLNSPTRSQLKMPTLMMCGAKSNPEMLSNEEIDLINQLKPGRYNKRKWEVIKRRDGTIDIRYPRSTMENRMELMMEAPSLTVMCTKILAEAKERDVRRKQGIFDHEDDQ